MFIFFFSVSWLLFGGFRRFLRFWFSRVVRGIRLFFRRGSFFSFCYFFSIFSLSRFCWFLVKGAFRSRRGVLSVGVFVVLLFVVSNYLRRFSER